MGPGAKPKRNVTPVQGDAPAEGITPMPHVSLGEEVARLREELALCDIKTAQLQAKLIQALDELDDQRRAHQRESKAERHVKEKLSQKLDGYLDEIRRLERERDDMREVVSLILEKVDKTNDYSSWPCPRIGLARPVEPLDRAHVNEQHGRDYHTTMQEALVVTLQKKLAEEQRAHLFSKQAAEAEILRLKAMIARRDAELEACATHNSHRLLLTSTVLGSGQSLRECDRPDCTVGRSRQARGDRSCSCHPSQCIEEDVTAGALLARTASRHRVLEREIDTLRRSVQRLQSSEANRSDSGRHSRQQWPDRKDASVQVDFEDVGHGGQLGTELPPSPGLQPRDLSTSPSPYNMTPKHARTPGWPQTPIHPESCIRYRTQHGNLEFLRRDIDVLSAEIDGFLSERDAVKSMLRRQLHKTPPAPAHEGKPQSAVPAAVLHDEGTCVRERQALREQLHAVERERERRENELRAEVESLRQSLLALRHDHVAQLPPSQSIQGDDLQHTLAPGELRVPAAPSPRASPTLVPHDAHEPLKENEPSLVSTRGTADRSAVSGHEQAEDEDGDELGEQSMELGTPVLASTILSIREEDWPVPPSNLPVSVSPPDPVDVPLPSSPASDNESGPAVLSSRPPSPMTSLSPPSSRPPSSPSPPLYIPPPRIPADLLARLEDVTQARVESIEREIAHTVRELADSEGALAGVRATAAQLGARLTSSGRGPNIPGPPTDAQHGGEDAYGDAGPR